MKAEGVIEVLRARQFPAAAWAVLEQVSNSTGSVGGTKRWLDLVAMSLWPSRGLELHGVEVKVSRSDWRRERADPKKADDVARFCHRFWVAAPAGVIPQDEVPPAWGLIEVTEKAAKVVKKPELLEPQPLTWAFVAAVLRRAAEAHEANVASRINEAFKARLAQEIAEQDAARIEVAVVERIEEQLGELRRAKRELSDLQDRVARAENVLGSKLEEINASAWRMRQARLNGAEVLAQAENLPARVRKLHDQLGRARAALDEVCAAGGEGGGA